MTSGSQRVAQATPAWVSGVALAISWLGAAATALIFVLLGRCLDQGDISPSTLTWLVVLALVAVACATTRPLFTNWATATTETALRHALVEQVFANGMRGAGRSGSSLAMLTGAVERTANYQAGFIGPIFGALTVPLLVLVTMAVFVDAATAGWLALLLVLVPLLIGGFRRLAKPIGASYRRSQGQLTAAFMEAIQALDTLIYARAARRIGADLAAKGEEHRKRLMRLLAGNQLLIFVVDASFSLAVVVAAAGISVSKVSSGQLSPGQAVAIMLLTTLIIGPVDIVGQFFYVGIGGRAARGQLTKFLAPTAESQPTGPGNGSNEEQRALGERSSSLPTGTSSAHDAHLRATDSQSAETGSHHEATTSSVFPSATADVSRHQPSTTNATIELQDVSAAWPGGPEILQDISFQVAAQERVALVGPSGVGKSSVSALIQAHLMPTSGRVLVNGLDTASADQGTIRSQLAVVEQRTFLFMGTIADNLRIADPQASDEQLQQALALAGLDEINQLPDGLATQVGQHGNALSGGQAQRIAIARAWLRDAPILLLDEPTSQVDLASEAIIRQALDKLAIGRTVLMISHRPGTIMAADRVVDLAHVGGRDDSLV